MKILIVRFSSIGDIVLTTPVLKAVKEQLSDVRVHYLTKRQFEPLLDLNPHIDRLHLIDQSIDEIIDELKDEQFDQIIDLHNNVRTRGLKMKLGIPMSSFPKLNLKKWILVNLKWDLMPSFHVVDRYFKAVEALGVINKGYRVEFFIRDENKVDVQLHFGLEAGGYFAVAIGAQFATKRMPKELIVKILDSLDKPAVLIGGREDLNLAQEVIGSSTNKRIHNACGDFNIGQSASIVKQSLKLLTNDTGMMHIASSFNMPIISVWGNTVPSLGMYPYRPDAVSSYSIHEVSGLNCRPCSKIGYQKCPKGHFKCMRSQDDSSIVKDLNA